MLRQVMLAGIANNEDYDCILVQISRDTQCRSEICAGRAAAKDSLQSPKLAGQFERFSIGDINHFVDVLDVYVRWNNLLADALDKVRSRLNNLSGLFVGLENRAVRICADNPDARVFLFQKPSGAGNRATRSESRDEVRNLPFSLPPKLRTGRSVMCFRICSIRILVGIKRIRSF